MTSIILSYGAGAGTSRTFNRILSVKGHIATDHHVEYPSLRFTMIDGTMIKKQAGFRRVFTIDLGMITNADDITHIKNWMNNESQFLTLSYNSGASVETDLQVVNRDVEWSSTWEGGIEAGRRVVIVCEESNMRTNYPAQAGYGFGYGTDYGDTL